jgi:hypothetical protein
MGVKIGEGIAFLDEYKLSNTFCLIYQIRTFGKT